MKCLAIVISLGWCLVALGPVKAAANPAIACVPPELGATMPRQPVRSSNIASIGYESSTNTLEVEFSSGAVYQYYGVPKAVYQGLMNASSHGSFLAAHVKGRYQYKEL